ncbi:hypothetical protein NDU88_002252 [Pleurodeles waltl]|uniref:Uncharacterized protein n=1 Tax=Pleurodeles waltl TaxID=8319 RepID=A0AAV7M006_PLEWA|nr:hypothetical protein NDU88_002252 [Pleurodeles waltl]
MSSILHAIQDSRIFREGKIKELSLELSLLRQDLKNSVDRVNEVELRVSEAENSIKSFRTTLTGLQNVVHQLEARVEDAEERPRWSIIRTVEILEESEGPSLLG